MPLRQLTFVPIVTCSLFEIHILPSLKLVLVSSKGEKAVAAHDPGGDASWKFLEVLGYGVGVANLPVGLALVVGSMLAESASRHQRRSETPMPDSWLEEISNSEGVSEKGLAFLAKTLEKNGVVSVADAVKWVEIEKRESQKIRAKQERENNLSLTGAQALIARTKNDCRSFLDVDGAVNSMKDSVESVSGFAERFFNKKDSQ